MQEGMRGRLIAAAALVPLVVGLAACGGSSEGDKDSEGTVPQTCPTDINQTASTPLPSDVPAPSASATPYAYFAQGATKVWFFVLDGDPDQLVSLRDAYDSTLRARGYEIKGTDQEPGHEAESDFKGAHEGTTNFRALCTGKVNFRLKLTS